MIVHSLCLCFRSCYFNREGFREDERERKQRDLGKKLQAAAGGTAEWKRGSDMLEQVKIKVER